MNAAAWERAKSLLADAADLPAADRARFVSERCADLELRREVLALLDTPAPLSDIIAAGTLRPGERLGPYVIERLLGRGGMGEVYRAADTDLKRRVAIKVLPAAVAQDGDRLARFQREAEVLAALNHPNIAHIHGLAKADGLFALVLELVDGPTLAERIEAGALALDEALPIAAQIAQALEAAHDLGIVHRDLKPANIKVRADGTVKVLDFGLAKTMEPAGASSGSVVMSPEVSPHLTQTGVILGTVAYMSPEQTSGKAADKRSDLWAFGMVLLEMLTGRRGLDGATIAQVSAAILTREPDWTMLPANTPTPIRRLLRRCLVKDPSKRLGDAGTARLEIEDARSAPLDDPSSATTVNGLRSLRNTRLAWLVASATVLTTAALAFPALRHLREPAPTETRTDIVTPAGEDPLSFALSPDGRQIVFTGAGGGAALWLRALRETTTQPLPGTEGALYPFWSPDGRSVGFFASGQLKLLDVGGGAPRTLAWVPGNLGATWSADGVILFASSLNGPLVRIAATGGPAVPATTLEGDEANHQWPVFLPDGRHFLFYVTGGSETGGIFLGALNAGPPTRLASADAAGAYLPSGWLLWVRAGTLLAQRLDLAASVLTGNPVKVADAVAFDPVSHRSAVSISATGLVAYRAGAVGRRQLTWRNRNGDVLGTIGASDENSLLYPSVAPDGRRVVVTRRPPQGNTDLWLLDRFHMRRFTFSPGTDALPIWSPDGSWIVFRSDRTGTRQLYVKEASGAGAETLLAESLLPKTPTDWSPDGRFLLFQTTDPQTGFDIWARPMLGDQPPRVFLRTPFSERSGRFSPDGRWVAYMSNESGREEIYVRPFLPEAVSGGVSGASPPASRVQPISSGGGIYPNWRPDGRELYFLAPDGTMMAAPITARGTALDPGPPVPLFPSRIVAGGMDRQQGRQYDLARDGRFLINTVVGEAAVAPITLIQNWQPDAKQ
jgi:serine/threonine protein kinase/Tol biopolymer transport system component